MTDTKTSNALDWFAVIAVLIGAVQVFTAQWLDAVMWLALGTGMWVTRDLNFTLREPFKTPAHIMGFALTLVALAAIIIRLVIDFSS